MPDEATLRMVARLQDEISGPLNQITHAFDNFKKHADTEGATSRFKGLSGAVKGFGSSITEFAEPALSAFGITAGISAASVIGLTKVVSDYARGVVDLRDSAAIMNMSTGSVINWDRAMRAAGVEGGVKSFQDFSIQLVKMKQNIQGVQEDWENRGLGRLFRQVQAAAKIGDTNKALELMYDHLQKLQQIDPARAEIFAQWWLHQPAAQALEARRIQQTLPPVDPAEAARREAQAAKLRETMAAFSVTWDVFYADMMEKLIPKVNEMMKSLDAGFQALPQYLDRVANSPAMIVLSKIAEAMTPKAPTPEKITLEGVQSAVTGKPLQPKLEPPSLARDFAGGPWAGIMRILQQGLRPPWDQPPVMQPPTTPWRSPGTAIQDAFQSMFLPTLDPKTGKPLPHPSRATAPADYLRHIGIDAEGKPLSQQPAQPIIVPPPTVPQPPAPWSSDFFTPRVPTKATPRVPETPAAATPRVPETPTAATEGKGILARLLEWAQSNLTLTTSAHAEAAPIAPIALEDIAKRLKLTEPTADVKRSATDIQKAAASFSATTDSKPGLQQQTESSDQARRMQKSATDLATELKPPASEAMRRLKDGANDVQQKDDETLRQRLLQQAQLAPVSIDRITQALGANKIEGSATLKVDIASPAGTKVAVDADGLFRQTEVSRRRAFQMEKTAFNDGFE